MITNRHRKEKWSDFPLEICQKDSYCVPWKHWDQNTAVCELHVVRLGASVCVRLQKSWMKLPNNQRVTNRFKCVGRARQIKGNEAMGISAYTEWVVSVIPLKEEGWQRERQDKTNQEAKWGSARAPWQKKKNKGRTVHTWWRKIIVTQWRRKKCGYP